MTLPIDRTTLTAAATNQVPNAVIQSAKNIAAITALFNGVDEVNNKINEYASAGTLSRLGLINVLDYNASGLSTTATGSITTGTKILTLTTTPDFVAGQGINLQGAKEVASLVISAAATASANCTVTLNGVAFTVALTSGASAIDCATAIRAGTFTGWTAGGTAGTTTVTFTSLTSGTKTDASYTVGTTGATGTMTTTTQGTADQISTVASVSGLVVNISDNSTRTIAAGSILHDDTSAIDAAQAALPNGGEIRWPSGTYLYTGDIDLVENILWQGAGNNGGGSKGTILKINAGANPAITNLSGFAQIKDMFIWNNGGTGVGIRATRKIHMHNVIVNAFVLPNLLLEHDATLSGPYESLFTQCRFLYSLHHGVVIGNGANVVTFINCEAKWNGWVNSDPTGASGTNSKDGFYVGSGYNPNAVTAAAPQSVTIFGGDGSYNSYYGWNFDAMTSSVVNPGYAEGNSAPTYQVRVGILQYCDVTFGTVAGGDSAVYLDTSTVAYNRLNSIWYGGKYLGGGNSNKGSYLLNNLTQFLAENVALTDYVYFQPVKDGSNNFTGEYKIVAVGTNGKYTFYHGSTNHMELTSVGVNFPNGFDATNGPDITGYWTHDTFKRTTGVNSPTTGAWNRGDIVFNQTPSAGGLIGWVCVVSGTPGTWKTWGAITA